jgi:hypothetical protein
VDEDFNAIDVCIVMPTARLRDRHRSHFERAIRRPLLSPEPSLAEACLPRVAVARRA